MNSYYDVEVSKMEEEVVRITCGTKASLAMVLDLKRENLHKEKGGSMQPLRPLQ